jgi:hypothetical protein
VQHSAEKTSIISPEWGETYQPRATPWGKCTNHHPKTSPERAEQRTTQCRSRHMMSDKVGIEVFCFGVRGDAVRPNCCAPLGLGPGWRIRIPGRCPGLDCSGPSGRGEVISPRAGMAVTFLRTALHNRGLLTASRHSGMFVDSGQEHAGWRLAMTVASLCGALLRDHLKTRSHRHPGERRGPERLQKTWIPAFAGMTFNGLCAILR